MENANVFNKNHDSFLRDICNKIWNDRYNLCNIKNIKSLLKSKNTIKTNIQKFSNTTIDILLILLGILQFYFDESFMIKLSF